MRSQIDDIYENVLKQNFDVEKFIKEHGESIINMFKLTDKERAIIQDKFVVVSQVDQETLPENERKSCIICLGDFEKDEKIILHPGCKHTFHDECVLEWFKTKLNCPVCKVPTRSNMLRNICKGDTHQFADRDQVLARTKTKTGGFIEGMVSNMFANQIENEIRKEEEKNQPKPKKNKVSPTDDVKIEEQTLNEPLLPSNDSDQDLGPKSGSPFKGQGIRIGGDVIENGSLNTDGLDSRNSNI